MRRNVSGADIAERLDLLGSNLMMPKLLKMVYQQVNAQRAAGVELMVERVITRYVIPLTTPRDSESARLEVAHILYEAIGDDLLADDVEIILNGTSLTGELVDVACQPKSNSVV